MSFVDNPSNRGVHQDFPIRNNMKVNKLFVKSGEFHPTKSVIFHPDAPVLMVDLDFLANTQDLINGYFRESVDLTGVKLLTIPSAVNIIAYLNTVLDETAALGTTFNFTITNNQTSRFTRSLAAGAGVILPGNVAVLTGNLIKFKLVVQSATSVVISRVNNVNPITTSAITGAIILDVTDSGVYTVDKSTNYKISIPQPIQGFLLNL